MVNRSVREALDMHLVRAGIREVEHLTEVASSPSSPKRVRKPVSLSTGFRKHVISTFIQAGLQHEIRELIVDHATQLDQFYFRPNEQQVLAEYLKAEPLLTIDPAARLVRENQTLKEENTKYQYLHSRIENLYTKLGL